MKHLLYAHEKSLSLLGAVIRLLWRTAALVIVPRLTRAAVLLNHDAARAIVVRVALVLALLVQLVLLLVLGYMIDLCLSLMEVWAELARKHLELTL